MESPTLMELPLGSYTFTDEREAIAVFPIVEILRREGHAVSVDEVREDDGRFWRLSILHYRTCKACKTSG